MDCRCIKCNSLLATNLVGSVKIKCSKQNCKTFNIFGSEIEEQTGTDQQTFINQDEKTLPDHFMPTELK